MTTLASERHCGVRVVCRFRPEAATAAGSRGRVSIAPASQQLALDSRVEFLSEDTIQVHRSPALPSASPSSFSLPSSKNSKERFTFDRVFWGHAATQNEVYEYTAKETVEDVLKGYNGTIFAYGQTGAGKSFTMFGPTLGDPELRGIIPRACTQLFAHIAHDRNSATEYTTKCSFLEIYKERFVRSEEEVLELLQFGERLRSVAATDMNVLSSRSHTDGSTKIGSLNLADLAGSEKVSKSGASGETLEEAKKINQSLSALGNCISALSKLPKGANPPSQAAATSKHIPYRDSKLTFILRESLGGNSKTTLVCACSPHSSNLEETVSTLRFGQRAKKIKNTVQVNEELSAIIAKLKEEVAMLRSGMEPTSDPAAETVDMLELEKLRNSSNLRIEELKEEMKAMKEELQQKDEIISRMTSEAAIAKASYLKELNQADRATKQLQLEMEQQARE
ncbi:Kinesin-like protein unc-104 [Balamuthia mandrillaris]